jgi:hypothetical protein
VAAAWPAVDTGQAAADQTGDLEIRGLTAPD